MAAANESASCAERPEGPRTRAPAPASAAAVARPITRDAPVTSAVLPCSDAICKPPNSHELELLCHCRVHSKESLHPPPLRACRFASGPAIPEATLARKRAGRTSIFAPKRRHAKRMPAASTNWVGAVRCVSLLIKDPARRRPGLVRNHSSVDRQGSTDDVGGFVRANEQDGVRNFLGSANALVGNL